jgi:hypothetical protein
MPKVALLFPYFRTKASTEMLFLPLGLASLPAQRHELDYAVQTFETHSNWWMMYTRVQSRW